MCAYILCVCVGAVSMCVCLVVLCCVHLIYAALQKVILGSECNNGLECIVLNVWKVIMYVYLNNLIMYENVHACVCMRVYGCVYACTHMCVCAQACVFVLCTIRDGEHVRINVWVWESSSSTLRKFMKSLIQHLQSTS